jgi:hypothetical protein
MSPIRTIIIAWMAMVLFLSLLVPLRLVAAEPNLECDYEKMFGWEDKTIFGRDCALCHSMGGPWEKPGGSLHDLFERKTLMTGEPVTEETVGKKIANGGPVMPGFKYTLTRAQIDDLVKYLKSADCTQDDSLEKAKKKLQEAIKKLPPEAEMKDESLIFD